MCWDLLQVTDAEDHLRILNAHSHPDILGPRQIMRDFQETCTPLGKDLKHMLWCLAHRVKDALDEGEWHLFMEQITHGIHKHQPRTPPRERCCDEVLMQRHGKALWQRLLDDLRKDGFQALSEEGTDGLKIGVFFESRCSTEECPLCWHTIKSVFPCLSAEHLCETLCPQSFWGTMPRQQSVHRLPQWKQQPQVDSLCLRNRLDGHPCDFHPIGV